MLMWVFNYEKRVPNVGLGFIWILALCTYLFPLRCSPLSSSPHLRLWGPIEKCPLLSLSPSRFFSDVLIYLLQMPQKCLSSPSLRYSSSAARAAGQHRGKGGVKGWRKQGGVDLWDIGRQFAGNGFLTFIWSVSTEQIWKNYNSGS